MACENFPTFGVGSVKATLKGSQPTLGEPSERSQCRISGRSASSIVLQEGKKAPRPSVNKKILPTPMTLIPVGWNLHEFAETKNIHHLQLMRDEAT